MTKTTVDRNTVKNLVELAKNSNNPEKGLDLLLDCFDQACDIIEQLQKEIAKKDKQLLDYSWQTNPDRMGGQFSRNELDNFVWK